MTEEMMLGKKVWAVVGANTDREKYGNIIFRRLLEKGVRGEGTHPLSHGSRYYEGMSPSEQGMSPFDKVYPVNPSYEGVEGHKCYKDLTSLPELPEVIVMVVSPKRGRPVIEEAARLGIKNIWLQPGTHDEALMQLINEKGLTAVQACVLVALSYM